MNAWSLAKTSRTSSAVGLVSSDFEFIVVRHKHDPSLLPVPPTVTDDHESVGVFPIEHDAARNRVNAVRFAILRRARIYPLRRFLPEGHDRQSDRRSAHNADED